MEDKPVLTDADRMVRLEEARDDFFAVSDLHMVEVPGWISELEVFLNEVDGDELSPMQQAVLVMLHAVVFMDSE